MSEELLTNFDNLVGTYKTHREYIERANKQAEKFSKAVIEKVILDHEIKASAVADDVLPLVPQLEENIAAIDAETVEINEGKALSEETMQELELRQMIGELTDDEFAEQSKELRETLEAANSRLEELSAQREILETALNGWVEVAASAGQADGTKDPDVLEEGDDLTAPPSPDDDEHVHLGGMSEDVSAVFDDAPAAAAIEVEEAGEAIAIGGAEDDGEDGPSAGVDFGFDSDDDGIPEGAAAVELNLVDDSDDVGASADEIGIDLAGAEPDAGSSSNEERRALLLYQEGTAEEQIYPLTEEALTIGRGRDNDIQIKNDSKVSRFHCKIYQKTAHYYIEDNKSSNGTLVNGELITERRLFGGEEVIIGETFFRFRIM